MTVKKGTRIKVNKVKYVNVLSERKIKWIPGPWKVIEVLPDDQKMLEERLEFLRNDAFMQERAHEVKVDRVVWRG